MSEVEPEYVPSLEEVLRREAELEEDLLDENL